MALASKHPDQGYIEARMGRYIEAWRASSPEKLMEFMHPEELQYCHFGQSIQKATIVKTIPYIRARR